jgi:hypothetical protein
MMIERKVSKNWQKTLPAFVFALVTTQSLHTRWYISEFTVANSVVLKTTSHLHVVVLVLALSSETHFIHLAYNLCDR